MHPAVTPDLLAAYQRDGAVVVRGAFDADARARRWRTSPSFPGLEDDLADGAPLDHPLFPVLWTAHTRDRWDFLVASYRRGTQPPRNPGIRAGGGR